MSDTQIVADTNADEASKYADEMAALSGEKVSSVSEPDTKQSDTQEETIDVVDNVAESDTFDPETLPPSAKARWEQTQNELREAQDRFREADLERKSLKGRVPSLQRQLQQYEAEHKQQRAAAPAPPQIKKDQSAAEYLSSPAWQKHKTDYPEEAAILEEGFANLDRQHQERYAQLEQRLGQFEEQLGPRISAVDQMRAESIERVAQAETATLDSAHSDWDQHFSLVPDGDTWAVGKVSKAMEDWLESQPEFMIDALCSTKAADCIWAMDLFKAATGQQSGATMQASTVKESRQHNLAKRSTYGSNGTGMARVDPSKMSPADAYAMEMRKLSGE